MDSTWIASTTNQGLRPVGAPGQRDHGVLAQLLAQHLSEEHAALFAEPVPNPDGRTTDWYAPLEGAAQPLDALEPGARTAAERRLAALHDDISGLAARLAQSRDADAAAKAALLQAALEIPDPSFIRVASGRPVLLAWAHLKDSPDAPKGVLGSWIRTRRPAAHTPAAAPPPPLPPAPGPASTTVVPVVVERAVWPVGLLWLMFALLALTIAWLMLSACGLGWPGGLGSPWLMRCPLPLALAGDDSLGGELERQRQLEQEIAQLQRALARDEAQCLPEPPPAPEPPQQRAEAPPPPPPECAASEIDRRREQAGGQTGEVTVSLGWDGLSDLDLAILCPNGNEIRFNNQRACGARLDVDMNAGSRSSRTPIENVFWSSKPRNGVYRVYVTLFDRRSDRRQAIPFQVELDVLGDRRQVAGEARRYREAELVTEFEITDDPPEPPDDCPPAAAPTEGQ
jgi:hypothetical protein